MSILWTCDGQLDVATSPSNLPGQSAEGSTVSGAMQRCANLRTDQAGMLATRDGSRKYKADALDQERVWHIITQGLDRYEFAGTKIYRNETSIATGMTDAQWSALLYSPFNSDTESVYAVNGTDRKRIEGSTVYEWGMEAPAAAPVIAAGTGTGLTGNYLAKVTYCRKESAVVVSESDPSPAPAAAVTLTNTGLSISWAASTDPQVTHVRIYRTLSGGGTYYFDADVAIGTTTYNTTKGDGLLGDSVEEDHERIPAAATFIAGPNYNGTLFAAVGNDLHYSKPKQPDYWPSLYYIEISPVQYPIQTIVLHNGQAYAITKHKIYYIQGTGSDTFFPMPLESVTGAQGPMGAVAVHGQGIFHVGLDGLYLFSDGDKNVTQKYFQPLFRGESVNGMPGATNLQDSWLVKFENRLYFGYHGLLGDYAESQTWEADYLAGTPYDFFYADTTNLSSNSYSWESTYSTATNTTSGYDGPQHFDERPSNILVYNFDNERWSYYYYPYEIRAVTVNRYNGHMVCADIDGYIRRLEDKEMPHDSGTAIGWEAESMAFTLQTRRHFPRWVKYDIDASDDDCTATGALVLDGTVHQSHTVTGERNTGRRLVATGNGKRCSMRVSGSGPVIIYATETE